MIYDHENDYKIVQIQCNLKEFSYSGELAFKGHCSERMVVAFCSNIQKGIAGILLRLCNNKHVFYFWQ